MRTRDDVRLLIEAGIKLGGTAAWDHALEFARLMDGTKDERVIGRTGLIMLLNDLTRSTDKMSEIDLAKGAR